MYNIEKGYSHREKVTHHDDRGFTDGWQQAVYEKALAICNDLKYNKIIDVGCGSGYKLVNMFGDKDITGLELEPALSFLKEKYPNHKWLESNFSKVPKGRFDMLICSDVIEHIDNPDNLLNFINKINCKTIVLSTPSRECYEDKYMNGPPRNPCHFREWTVDELNEYLSQSFGILEHYVNSFKGQHCQIVVMEKY